MHIGEQRESTVQQNAYFSMLSSMLNLAQKEVLGKHIFHNREGFLQSIDDRAKIENKVTKTDVLVNNLDWMR